MKGQEHLPGEWLDISDRGEYQRLVRLARRRLVGHEHHAEDVVSRAVIKWSTISPEKQSVARIEQVIKSEAFSVLRSEDRSRHRETRVVHDRASGVGGRGQGFGDPELCLLRRALAETCKRESIPITTVDVEVIEALFAGCNVTTIARLMGLTRHEVRRSKRRWQSVVTKTIIDPG